MNGAVLGLRDATRTRHVPIGMDGPRRRRLPSGRACPIVYGWNYSKLSGNAIPTAETSLRARSPASTFSAIVDAGIRAPSGYNGQSTSFVVVDDPAILERVASILSGDAVGTAAAIVFVVMDDRPRPNADFRFGVEDYSAACENILLAVTALGYASVWIDGALRKEGRASALAALLGVPAPLEIRVALPLGIPAEARSQKEKKPFGERAWFNRYGGV